MAVLTSEKNNISNGIGKEIDDGAKDLIFSFLQETQYQFPIKSTLRETTSNSLDSVKEKLMAISILSGAEKVEDYFQMVETNELTKDSKFDPTYYNLTHLSTEDNQVVISYNTFTDPSKKDYISIKDHGVGLSGKRLVGYFQLGWSSKRLLKQAIGKFGLGNKSPLSITPMYTMSTRYNGLESKFNIFTSDVQAITPRFADGKANTLIEYAYDSKGVEKILSYYGRPTEECNGITVEVNVKKHHKSSIIEAVEHQLMYLKDILFNVYVDEELESTYDTNTTELLYEDEDLICSKNSIYTKPHILINNVNYGIINFNELEINDLYGNVGFKMDVNEVDIHPSRESLIWSDKTRDSVLAKLDKVKAVIERDVTQALSTESDLYSWLLLCSQVKSHNKKSYFSSLLGLIDTKRLNFSQKFGGKIITLKEFNYSNFREVSVIKDEVSTTKINFAWELSPYLYIVRGLKSKEIDAYLCKLLGRSFTALYIDRFSVEEQFIADALLASPYCVEYPTEVPEAPEAPEMYRLPTPAEIRRQNEEILIHVVKTKSRPKKIAVKVKDLEEFKKSGTPIYRFDLDNEKLAQEACYIGGIHHQQIPGNPEVGLVYKRVNNYSLGYYCGSGCVFIGAAKHLQKHLADLPPVEEFFFKHDYETNAISIPYALKAAYTGSKLREAVNELQFLCYMESSLKEDYSVFKELSCFSRYSRDLLTDVIKHLDKLYRYQVAIEEATDKEFILNEVSLELFGVAGKVSSIDVADSRPIREIEVLRDKYSSVSLLLNNVDINKEGVEDEVYSFLKLKKII